MIKYYYIDSATDERTDFQDRVLFYSSLIYNLDESVKNGDKTTYEALCDLKLMMNQERANEWCEVSANGFYYNIEVIKEDLKMTYRELKEKARQEAIEWQNNFANNNYSYGELAYYSNYFEKLGRRYGLLKEFRENGIC